MARSDHDSGFRVIDQAAHSTHSLRVTNGHVLQSLLSRFLACSRTGPPNRTAQAAKHTNNRWIDEGRRMASPVRFPLDGNATLDVGTGVEYQMSANLRESCQPGSASFSQAKFQPLERPRQAIPSHPCLPYSPWVCASLM